MEKDSKIMIENVLKLKSKNYPEFARKHEDDYRTLNDFINKRAKELNMTKAQIAELADTKNQSFNYWEKNGISKFESALKLALALKLDFEQTNDFLNKYAGMRQLFSEEEYEKFQKNEILDGKKMGIRAQAYLEKYVKGSRFQKSYQKTKALRKDVWLQDMIFFEEKKYYQKIYEKFQEGQYPTKNELIELGLILRMKRTEIDEMLQVCGHYPLSAKKLYEGALILALSYIENVEGEQFNVKQEHFRPLDYKIMLQELLEECISKVTKKLKKSLDEQPSWYLLDKKSFREEKQRFAAIMVDMEKHIFNTWLLMKTEGKVSPQLDCSLRVHVDGMLDSIEYKELDEVKEQQIIVEIEEIEKLWADYKKQPELVQLTNGEFRKLYSSWFIQLRKKYIDQYAPYLKEKRKQIDGN